MDDKSKTMKKISLDHPHKLANTISSLDIVALSNIHGSPGRVVVICKEGQFGFIDLASEEFEEIPTKSKDLIEIFKKDGELPDYLLTHNDDFIVICEDSKQIEIIKKN